MNPGLLRGMAGFGPNVLSDSATPDPGQDAVLVAGARKEVAFVGGTTPTIDVSGFRFASIYVTSGLSTPAQDSNDGVNWSTNNVVNVSGSSLIQAGTMSSGGPTYCAILHGRFFRLSGGSAAGTIEFFTFPPPISQAWPAWTASVAGLGDALSNGTTFLVAQSAMLVYNGSASDRLRTPTTFKTATATAAGDTAVWTPTAGKKFRLMRYRLEITSDAATSGGAEIDIVLRDATTATAQARSVFVPAAGGTILAPDPGADWVDIGNGQLSALANNVLNVNLSAALTAGKVRVVCCGTEE